MTKMNIFIVQYDVTAACLHSGGNECCVQNYTVLKDDIDLDIL